MSYSRPEAYYFYGYYVFMNVWWIVIPACKLTLVAVLDLSDLGYSREVFLLTIPAFLVCVYQSIKVSARAIAASGNRTQMNGSAKKNL